MATHPDGAEAEAWQRLASDYDDRGLVLVLGAGISLASGFPSWIDLLRRIGREHVGHGGEALVNELLAQRFTLPAIAGILESRSRTTRPFIEQVRDALYAGFPFHRQSLAQRDDELVHYVTQGNATLRAVAALCATRIDNGSYVPNARIHAVINLNLDAVLRAFTRARYGVRLLRTIERASATASAWRINTYHVHGFLQFDQRKIGNADSEADRIVFTEGEYYDFFGNPFGMFSNAMLHLLREHPCCFIGLSMTDENLRRLLHYSRAERLAGYLGEGCTLEDARERSLRHTAILCHSGSTTFDDAQALSLEQLGVRVAWVHDYRELPDKLGAAYSATGANWHDVY